MKSVFTEADIPAAGELVVTAGSIITPSARDLARERGVTLRELPKGEKPAGAPPARTVAIGCDHGGVAMKRSLLTVLADLGLAAKDVGIHDEKPADYPDIALAVARAITAGEATRGIVIDGAGIGSCMAANKVAGIRAALCYDVATARNSREHNDANVLTLGGRLLTDSQAETVVRTWIATKFAGGRHQARVDKIMQIESTRS